MTSQRSVLVLGDHETALASLAERSRGLGYRTVRAKTPDDAVRMARERGFRFAVALLPADLPVPDLGLAIEGLRLGCNAPDLTVIATGEPALEEDRARLRRAGVEHALWEPVGENALRFQLNRALARGRGELLRASERIPTDWVARVWSRGREKDAGVYSLSSGGVFLVTRRPSQKGNEVAVEIPLPGGAVRAGGRVVYTNVPGNLRRHGLPDGMAVRFTELTAEDDRRLRSAVAGSAAQLTV